MRTSFLIGAAAAGLMLLGVGCTWFGGTQANVNASAEGETGANANTPSGGTGVNVNTRANVNVSGGGSATAPNSVNSPVAPASGSGTVPTKTGGDINGNIGQPMY